MAKFHGKVGYIYTKETSPGVYTEVVTERDCVGDILRNNKRWEKSENLNDDITISNTFSILTDEYINQNIKNLRYIQWMGAKWKITSFEIQRPRIILTIGGVYNG
jgi:hypothetical protein